MKQLSYLRQILTPPLTENREINRQTGLVYYILLATLFASLIFVAIQPQDLPIIRAILVYSFVTSLLLISVRYGYLLLPSLFLPTLLLVVISYVIFKGYGLHDVAFIAFPIIMIMAGLLLGWRGGLAFFILSIIVVNGLVYAEVNGLKVNSFSSLTSYNDGINASVLLGVIAFLLYLQVNSLRQSLYEGQRNEQALIQSNRQLESLKSSLEGHVAERTQELSIAKELAEQRANQLAILNEITQGIITETEIETAAQNIAQQLHTLFKAKSVAILLLDKTQTHLLVAGKVGLTVLQQPSLPLVNFPSFKQLVQSPSSTLLTPDKFDEFFGPFGKPMREAGISMLLFAPLISRKHVIGLFLITLGEPDRVFTKDETSLVETIAGQAASVLEQLRLLQQEQEARQAAEMARQAAEVARQAAEVARQAAEVANRAKSQFLSNMSHELRTPLNGILGYAQILRREPNLTTRQLDGLGIIHQSGEHLLTLIKDILDLSKIEAGKIELQVSPIHLPTFLKTIADIVNIRAKQKGIDFVYEILDSLPHHVEADETRLRQVLLNLLGNAIKFTDNGTVRLVVNPLDETPWIRFEVIDTGVGIAPENLEKIFQPFEQIKGSDQWSEGTGLGLAITRQLVQMMGGEIALKSQMGQGSVFAFAIPLPILTPTLADSMPSTSAIVGYNGPRRKILVVDDKSANRLVLLNLLEPLGFTIFFASDGQEGLQMAQECEPDVILLDLVMPKMNGFDMARLLRQKEAFKGTIVIAVSASVFEKEKEQSLIAGCTDFLPKPVREKELLTMLAHYLDLTWQYERPLPSLGESPLLSLPDEPPTGPSAWLVPPVANLQTLLHFAERGNLRAVRQEAEKLAQDNSQYEPFTQKVIQLAKEYEDKEIVALLQKNMPLV